MRSRSTTCPERQRGFVLPTAIFLLVILSALAAFMLHVSGASHASSALDVQGARAYQAARVGAEMALFQIVRNAVPNCPAAAQTIALPAGLRGFSVTWTCAATAYTEAGDPRTVYLITSTARYGTTGSNDYVERQLQLTAQR